jgi:hypothetical protein
MPKQQRVGDALLLPVSPSGAGVMQLADELVFDTTAFKLVHTTWEPQADGVIRFCRADLPNTGSQQQDRPANSAQSLRVCPVGALFADESPTE